MATDVKKISVDGNRIIMELAGGGFVVIPTNASTGGGGKPQIVRNLTEEQYLEHQAEYDAGYDILLINDGVVCKSSDVKHGAGTVADALNKKTYTPASGYVVAKCGDVVTIDCFASVTGVGANTAKVLFTLDEEYRPSRRIAANAWSNTANANPYVIINTDGTVNLLYSITVSGTATSALRFSITYVK